MVLITYSILFVQQHSIWCSESTAVEGQSSSTEQSSSEDVAERKAYKVIRYPSKGARLFTCTCSSE